MKISYADRFYISQKQLFYDLVKLYKSMLNGRIKHWIHQKAFSDGVILIEWHDRSEEDSDFVYLHPVEQCIIPYKKSL